MTLHTVRRKPAGNGYREPKYKVAAVAIMCRLAPADFASLRRIAGKRGTPLAAVIRDAISGYLHRHRAKGEG
jgi:hypothetical protein